MGILTAHQLWRDYDPSALPLDTTFLCSEKTDSYTVDSYYFNGEATADGCSRIFAQVYSPIANRSGNAFVLMNDASSPFDTTYVDFLIGLGFTVLVPDYVGKRKNGKYTIYPESLSHCNFYNDNNNFSVLSDLPRQSCLYSYTCVMLRSYFFLSQQENINKDKIGFFGVREGAFQVYKSAFVQNNAFCAISLFNSCYVPTIDTKSDKATVYNACLANSSYASLLSVPTYVIDTSNNGEDSLFSLSSLYSSSSDSVSFYIAEHTDNTLTPKQFNSLKQFILAKESNSFLPTQYPLISAKNSDRHLYYEITVPNCELAESVNAYYCYGEGKGQYRNWIRLPLERISENEYIAKADVFLLKDNTSAFVNVRYKDGFTISSDVITRIPMMMGVTSKQIIKSRLIYESEMGTDAWLVSRSKFTSAQISIEQGNKGIYGVTSSVNSLSSLNIGDVHTCGERDSILQLLIYTDTIQNIDIEITCSFADKYYTYSTRKYVSAFGEWSKVTVSANELKSEVGTMSGWDNAICITVNSEDKLLINSLLWI